MAAYYPPYQPSYQPTYPQPYADRMLQPQYPQVQPAQIPQVQAPTYSATQALNGKFVDSIESVKATDVMMDGSVMYFPTTDGKTIYTKQLQSDGTSRILTFALVDQTVPDEKQPSVTEVIDSKFKTFREDILAGFEDIGDRFDKIERKLNAKTTRGGKEE